MPKFNVEVDHQNTRDDAVEKLRGFSEQILKDAPVEVSDVEEVWDESGKLDFSFKAMGFKISGTMVTSAEKVTVAGNLPFAALPFRGALESQIADKVKEAIA
ncbi:MAG: polyhydroxyalkanoic acid system family protein [Mariniblastus sp.]